MRNKIWLLALTGVGLVSALTGFEIGQRPAGNDSAAYVRRRPVVLLDQAKSYQHGGVLVIGDSISERSGISTLCGLPVFNAGISSARTKDLADLTPKLVAEIKPTLVFIALGTNDANAARPTAIDEWQKQYEALVRSVGRVPVVLAAAPMIERGKERSSQFDTRRIAAMNARLPSIAARFGAVFVTAAPTSTMDGVHPDTAGAETWRGNLARGCPTNITA